MCLVQPARLKPRNYIGRFFVEPALSQVGFFATLRMTGGVFRMTAAIDRGRFFLLNYRFGYSIARRAMCLMN
jgi:hypothetical protein